MSDSAHAECSSWGVDRLQQEITTLQERLILMEDQMGDGDPTGIKALLRSVIDHQQEVLDRL